eukprot:2598461-Prymnesium_polylepis.1
MENLSEVAAGTTHLYLPTHPPLRGDTVILKSYNRANLTTPPLRTSLSDVRRAHETPKMSVWVHRGHTHRHPKAVSLFSGRAHNPEIFS